jgi:peptidoglycan/xylan/chitin deacetylase (PgdA/CDA1 family)
MDSPSVQGLPRLVLRGAMLLALVLPALAVLDAVAHGDRHTGGALSARPPLLASRWYPPLPISGTKAPDCPPPARVLRRHGSRHRRLVALTFDDGPSIYTPAVLRTLRRHHAHATFFVVGIHITGREATLRHAVAAGDELGDHSWDHPPLPSHWEIRRTSDALRRTTGVRSCLFRPPYGLVDRRLLRSVGSLGMTTVGWNVDSADWAGLRAKAIAAHVLRVVRPGSIVLMHDGGGIRVRTVKALGRILRGLRRRGYRPTTVSRLLRR